MTSYDYSQTKSCSDTDDCTQYYNNDTSGYPNGNWEAIIGQFQSIYSSMVGNESPYEIDINGYASSEVSYDVTISMDADMSSANQKVDIFVSILQSGGMAVATGVPGLTSGMVKTQIAFSEMKSAGILTIGTPIIITVLPMLFGLDNQLIAEMLGGYMAGVTVSGVLWAIFQNNAGGAWDNAKKSFEAGVEINGEMTFKGSDAHKASVTGDTVGDPFKDTSGPSMNILIKLTCLIGLVIAPILGGHGTHDVEHKSVTYIYDATYLDTFEMGNEDKVLIVQSMVRDLIAKDYTKVADYLSEDVVFNLSDGSLIEGKESAMKHISDTYSQVDIEDYSVAVNLAVTGDNGDEWVLLWDEGNIVESNGESTIKSWMESFRFDGDKINFINMYSK